MHKQMLADFETRSEPRSTFRARLRSPPKSSSSMRPPAARQDRLRAVLAPRPAGGHPLAPSARPPKVNPRGGHLSCRVATGYGRTGSRPCVARLLRQAQTPGKPREPAGPQETPPRERLTLPTTAMLLKSWNLPAPPATRSSRIIAAEDAEKPLAEPRGLLAVRNLQATTSVRFT
jgi:hypothetical protein